MIVSVLIPSTGRAEQMLERVSDLLAQSFGDGVELQVILAIQDDDYETLEAVDELSNIELCLRYAGTTAVEGWNDAFKLAYHSGASWFVLGADDIIWRPGWLDEGLRVAGAEYAEVIGFNDGHTNIFDYAPHYMVSRSFIERRMGGVFIPPVYKSWWFDREVCEIARDQGVYAPAWDARVDHLHPDWGTADQDETYLQAEPWHRTDRAVWIRRKEAGYPVDYPSLIDGVKAYES